MTPPPAPRLEPLTREQCGDAERAALAGAFSDTAADRLLAGGPDAAPMPSVIATLLHHPGLAGPFLTYNNVLLQRPTLDPRLRELTILRVAWRTRAPYEWAQHVRLARGLGVTDEEIDAIGRGAGDERWSALEADALAATDQLLDHYRVDDATWRRLADHLDPRRLVELLFVVGTYTGLAMAFNSFGLQLDADLADSAIPPLPDREEH